MGGKMDQVKGRIKEAAGVLTDDDCLKQEGKLGCTRIGERIIPSSENRRENNFPAMRIRGLRNIAAYCA